MQLVELILHQGRYAAVGGSNRLELRFLRVEALGSLSGRHRIAGNALDLKAELPSLLCSTVQRLGDIELKARAEVVPSLILIGERRGILCAGVFHIRLKHAVLVGHDDRDLMGGAVVRHALAVGRSVLLDVELVRTGFGECRLFKRRVLGLAILQIRHGGRHRCGARVAVKDHDVVLQRERRGVVGSGELERKGFVLLGVAAHKGLARLERSIVGITRKRHVRRVVGVVELRGLPLGQWLLLVAVHLVVGDGNLDAGLVAVTVRRRLELGAVDRRVIRHAVHCVVVIDGRLIGTDLVNVIHVGVAHMLSTKRGLCKRNLLALVLHEERAIAIRVRALRKRRARSLGLDLEGEHAALERCSLATVIRVALVRHRCGTRGLCAERIGKDRGLVGDILGLGKVAACIVGDLGHLVGCDLEGTVAVVLNHNGHLINGLAVSHAGNHRITGGLNLADGVFERARAVEGDIAKAARGALLGRRRDLHTAVIGSVNRVLGHGIACLDCLKLDIKGVGDLPLVKVLLVLHKVVRRNRLGGGHVICVLKLGMGNLVGRDGALIVRSVRLGKARRNFLLGHRVIGIRIETIDGEGLVVLEGLLTLAILVEHHVEGLGNNLALSVLDVGLEGLARSGGDADLKLELLALEHAGIDVLARRDAGILVDRQGTRHLDGELAVVAKINVDFVGVVDVIPTRVDNLGGRAGEVLLFAERQGVDARQARGAGLDEVSAVGRLAPICRKRIKVRTLELGDRPVLCGGLAIRVLLVIRALVIVGLARHGLSTERLRARAIGVERRVLGKVIEAVGLGGHKGGSRVAELLISRNDHAVIEVGVEGGLTTFAVVLDVCAQRVVCRATEDRVTHAGLDAHAIEDAQRERLADCHFRFRVGGRDLEIAQGNEGRGDLDRHDVALSEVVAALDLNDEIRHVHLGVELGVYRSAIGIGVNETVGGLHRIELRVGENERLELIHLHVRAELIGEGDVAGLAGHTLGRLGRGASTAVNLVRNLLEDTVQLIRIRCGLVVVGVFGAGTEIVPLLSLGVVARHGVHVGVEAVVGGLSRVGGVGALENTDGINGGSAVLQRLARFDCRGCDVRIKVTLVVRLAVGKEDNDLLGILASATQGILGP